MLRLKRAFQTRTSPYCQKGIEPVVNIGLPRICLTGEKPPIVIDDVLDATTTVPSTGSYAWHVNQSTRPFVGAAGDLEAYELTCEDAGAVLERRTVTIARGQDVTLNLGCGGGATTLSGGTRLGPPPPTGGAIGPPPSVDGVSAVFRAAAKLAKPRRLSASRGRKFSACTRSATRRGGTTRARAAQRACQRRFGL